MQFDWHRHPKSPEDILSCTPDAEGYLAAAVLAQAFHDSGFLDTSEAPGSGGVPLDRTQAVQFLTSTRGGWAEARNEWANAAGMDGDFVRELALRVSKQRPRASTKPRPHITTASRKVSARGPVQVLPATVETLQARLAALDAAGIDIRTATARDVAQALNAASLTTRTGLTYDRDAAGALKLTYRRCVAAGAIEP